jgi:hypothetical protein
MMLIPATRTATVRADIAAWNPRERHDGTGHEVNRSPDGEVELEQLGRSLDIELVVVESDNSLAILIGTSLSGLGRLHFIP